MDRVFWDLPREVRVREHWERLAAVERRYWVDQNGGDEQKAQEDAYEQAVFEMGGEEER